MSPISASNVIKDMLLQLMVVANLLLGQLYNAHQTASYAMLTRNVLSVFIPIDFFLTTNACLKFRPFKKIKKVIQTVQLPYHQEYAKYASQVLQAIISLDLHLLDNAINIQMEDVQSKTVSRVMARTNVYYANKAISYPVVLQKYVISLTVTNVETKQNVRHAQII